VGEFDKLGTVRKLTRQVKRAETKEGKLESDQPLNEKDWGVPGKPLARKALHESRIRSTKRKELHFQKGQSLGPGKGIKNRKGGGGDKSWRGTLRGRKGLANKIKNTNGPIQKIQTETKRKKKAKRGTESGETPALTKERWGEVKRKKREPGHS